MAFEAKYPHAKFVGPLAENLLALVRANIVAALAQIAEEDETAPLAPFALVTNGPWGRTTKVFPVCWLEDEDTPLKENEDAALLEETHRFNFGVAAKKVITATLTPQAQVQATTELQKETRIYVRAVLQIFLSANPVADLTAGLDKRYQSLPVITDMRSRVYGPTGGNNEFIGTGQIVVEVTMQEGK